MKAYEKHERHEGKLVSHPTVKKLLAAFAVSLFTDIFDTQGVAIDRFFEEKHFDHLDR